MPSISPLKKSAQILFVVLTGALLSGCLAALPAISMIPGISGAAGGSSATDASESLEKCSNTLGTLRISEDTNASWYRNYRSRYGSLGSTVPALRVLIQQSNCFVIVERGRAMRQVEDEMRRGRGDETRAGSSVQKGQRVFADYTMVPEVTVSAQGTSGAGGGLFGRGGGLFKAIAGGFRKNESSTTLLLLDNRSAVQISASEGYASSTNLSIAGGLFGGRGGGGAGAFSKTPEGKTIMSAFVDSYNKMVKSLRQYKAQTVKGGLGRGGRLGVQGGQTPASK
ncbi:MAG: CsgG/HfaB family protein [Burkholderiaceae bacterium]